MCIIFIKYSRGCSLLPSSFKLGWVNYKNNFWKLDQGWKVFFWIKWLIWTILDVLNLVFVVLIRGKRLKCFIIKCWPLIIMKARLLESIISAALYIAPPWNCGCFHKISLHKIILRIIVMRESCAKYLLYWFFFWYHLL